MKIDVIDSPEEFQALKSNFDFVYSADPQARFFTSWIWLSIMLKKYDEYHEPWFLLAARPDEEPSNYVAFFPLKVEIHERNGDYFYNQLCLAGVTDAHHAPFVSLPEYQNEAIFAFASYLQQREEWSDLKMKNVEPTDERLRLFLSQFSQDEFDSHEQRHLSDLDAIDNNIVPFIALPNDWDEYLQNNLSSNSRQRVKRFLRKIEDSDEYRITQVNADNLENHIGILHEFWKSSWEGRKGKDRCHRFLNHIEFSLHYCFENNCLYFPVLWKGDQPLGAIANLMDSAQKTILFLIGGRDDTVKDIPSGIVLHAYSIRYAIQQGFKIYDFLMGNEAYKFSFGAQERHIRTVFIQRKNFVNLERKLDVKTIPSALHIATTYHQANRLMEAEHLYRQILTTQPAHPEALYGLGVMLQRREDYPAAETVLKTLLDLQPDNTKAWFSLGTLHQAQGQLQEAETAYRRALATEPESLIISMAVHHNLGYTLQQQGKWEEGIACYERARRLQPDCLETEVIWASAMHAQGKLSPNERTHYAAISHYLGNRRKHAGDLKAAVEYYRQAIAMQPDLVTAHYNLGLALESMGKREEAIVCYQKALALQPDYREAETQVASAHHALGKLAPDQQAHYAAICTELGTQHKENDDLEAAIQFYRQAIALQPDLATAHYKLGMALQERGEEEEAVACYQTALELQPHDRDADIRLAAVLHALGRLSAEQQTDYALLNYELGNQCKQAGDFKGAVEYYQQALAMNPALADARAQLRLSLQEQNDVQIKVSCAKR
jgi:tetratricopeptide (TPR) repeat protein